MTLSRLYYLLAWMTLGLCVGTGYTEWAAAAAGFNLGGFILARLGR